MVVNMLNNYDITIIQNENVPLAAMPYKSGGDTLMIVLILIVMAMLVAAIWYLWFVANYRRNLLAYASNYMARDKQYRGIRYSKLKDMEKEIEQIILEKSGG